MNSRKFKELYTIRHSSLCYCIHLIIPLLLLFLLLISCRGNEKKTSVDLQKTERIVESVELDGKTRRYIYHIPENWQDISSLPVVFVLHGGRSNPEDIEEISRFHLQGNPENFITVYPASEKRFWNDGRAISDSTTDEIKFIHHIIDTLQTRYPVNEDGIFSTGFSNGGSMSVRLACESGQIKAVSSVASTAVKQVIDQCNPDKPKSIMIIQGGDDSITSIDGVQKSKREIVSHEYAIQKFLSLNECSSDFTKLSVPDTSESVGTKKVYRDCANDSEVISIILKEGGHTWPGGPQYRFKFLVGKTIKNIDASEVIWEFFSQQMPEQMAGG